MSLFIVYADNVEPPLARWGEMAQIFARDGGQFVPLCVINRSFGRLDVMGSPGFNLDEAKYVPVPTDQVNFTPTPMRAVVTRDHHISKTAKIKVSVLFATPSGPLVRRSIVGRTNLIRNTVDCVDNRSHEPGGHIHLSAVLVFYQGSARSLVEK